MLGHKQNVSVLREALPQEIKMKGLHVRPCLQEAWDKQLQCTLELDLTGHPWLCCSRSLEMFLGYSQQDIAAILLTFLSFFSLELSASRPVLFPFPPEAACKPPLEQGLAPDIWYRKH